MLTAVQSYLEVSEEKITVCILLNENNEQLYTIGEKASLDKIESQLVNDNLGHCEGDTLLQTVART